MREAVNVFSVRGVCQSSDPARPVVIDTPPSYDCNLYFVDSWFLHPCVI